MVEVEGADESDEGSGNDSGTTPPFGSRRRGGKGLATGCLSIIWTHKGAWLPPDCRTTAAGAVAGRFRLMTRYRGPWV